MIKKEIEQIDCELMANGGVNCGWDAADHDDYLKVRTKMGNKMTVAFITAMRRAVPTADEISVRAHFDAHSNYLKMVEDKKELIAKYKQAKEEERKKRLQLVDGTDRLNADLGLNKQARHSSQMGLRSSSMGLEDKIKRREQLRDWQEKKLHLADEQREAKLKA